MKLELRKFPIKGSVLGAFIANIVILGFIVLVSLDVGQLDELPFANFSEAFMIIDTIVRGTFTVFAAAMLSRMVISEFKNKSITVLFMYPINRKKLILSKLIIVVIFTLVAVVLSNLIIGSGFYIINHYIHIVLGQLTSSMLIESMIGIGMRSVATSLMCLIPLYFGMKKYSGTTTVIASLIIVSVVCSNNMGFSLSSIIAVPISMGIVGLLIAYYTIRRIESDDLT